MKQCELCGDTATICCESDQASLCWECDDKVHGANFLVAKHERSLLCHICQSPTPWKASGHKFYPTVSVCVANCTKQRREGDGEDTQENYDCDDYSDNSGEEENQVVPWSCSNSESLNSSVCGGDSPLKRSRRNAGLDSDDETGSCTSQMRSGSLDVNQEDSSPGLIRPLKQQRRTSELLNQLKRLEDRGETESRSAAAVSTVGR